VMKQTGKKSLFDAPLVRFAAGMLIFLASAGFFGLLSLNLAIKRGEKVTVPNLVNKSVVEALDILSERNLELRKETARNSAIIPENYVLSQDPIPGTVVKEGTPILVVISLGSKISLVPDLVGKSVREARVDLNRAGLEVGRSAAFRGCTTSAERMSCSPNGRLPTSRSTEKPRWTYSSAWGRARRNTGCRTS